MPAFHYIYRELCYRGLRTTLMVAGLGMALALPQLLDVVGRGFLDLARTPFKDIGAQLIVQRGAVAAALPKEMGIMLPYSAQAITRSEADAIARVGGVEGVADFVQLWNFGVGRFYTLGGIPLDPGSPAVGPGKVRDWVVSGRLPHAGGAEVMVERHYAAFYGLTPGTPLDLGGDSFTVVGIVDIKNGSQITASNIYLDIGIARRLGGLRDDEANQLFIKVAADAAPDAVQERIASTLPNASVVSSDGVLRMLGGIAQMLGGMRGMTLIGGAVIALGLSAALLYGTLLERRRDSAILASLGWTRTGIRRHLAAEMGVQGFLAGFVALAVIAGAIAILETVSFTLPAHVGGEHPSSFMDGVWQPEPLRVGMTLSLSGWELMLPPFLGAALAALLCWIFLAWSKRGSPWQTLKAG